MSMVFLPLRHEEEGPMIADGGPELVRSSLFLVLGSQI
jgi:hypothetical protein